MAFPRRLLTENEEVVLDLRPHAIKAIFVPAVRTILIAVPTWFLVSRYGGELDGKLGWGLAVVALVLWWVLAGLRYVRWRFTEYVLTNERLISRSGIIAKRAKEIPLERVNDITFTQSVLDRLLDAGDITIESAGEYGQETLNDVGDPADVQKAIYRASEGRKGLHPSFPRPLGGDHRGLVADELAKLADLRDRGVLSAEEFDARKRSLLEG